MSISFHVDEHAAGFEILEDYNDEGKEVAVYYTLSYDPECYITLTISPEMFREILAEMEGDDVEV